jgi:DNA-directed RNA polymerase sigma subunit (sigma70/sigma32)
MSAEDAVFVESLKHDMECVLANLPARDAGVVRMRFGLVDGHERTLDEIGEKFNVSGTHHPMVTLRAILGMSVGGWQ